VYNVDVVAVTIACTIAHTKHLLNISHNNNEVGDTRCKFLLLFSSVITLCLFITIYNYYLLTYYY